MANNVKMFKFWDRVFSTYLSRGESSVLNSGLEDLKITERGLITRNGVSTFVYTLDGLPNEVETDLRNSIRSECRGDVRVSFITLLDRHVIDWSSTRMKSMLRNWQILDSTTEDSTVYNLHKTSSSVDKINWRKISLIYWNDVKKRKRRTFRYRTLVLITGTQGREFDESASSIEEYCRQREISLNRVLYNVDAYLKMFSPFKLSRNSKLESSVGNLALPDELLSRLTSFSQGRVGNYGEYWGTDIFSCYPCFKPSKVRSTDAETWLITAETGGGKSYLSKTLDLQLLARTNVNGTINDIEGGEYSEFEDIVTSGGDICVVLNFAEGVGLYRDPVPIVLTGDEENDLGMFSLSSSTTSSMFRILVGEVELGLATWVGIIIDEAIASTYTNAGVHQEDMSTWKNSHNLSIFSVYDSIKKLLISNDSSATLNKEFADKVFSNEDFIKALQVTVAKLSRYFEKNGTLRSTFANKVTLEEIAHAKLVINSFGMAGKSPDTIDPVQMALMQLYAANISHIRSIFSKVDGKFNFKVWEEFQRWGDFPNSEKIISTPLTGGRKLGDINIILTNNIGKVLDNDRFGIFGNLTTIAIGCIWDYSVRHQLCERLSLQAFESSLDELVKHNKDLASYVDGDSVDDSAYSKAFLLGLDKTFYTIARVELPDEINSSTLFQTGVVLKEPDDNIVVFGGADE